MAELEKPPINEAPNPAEMELKVPENALTWSCVMGNEKFNGVTTNEGGQTLHTWLNQAGHEVHQELKSDSGSMIAKFEGKEDLEEPQAMKMTDKLTKSEVTGITAKVDGKDSRYNIEKIGDKAPEVKRETGDGVFKSITAGSAEYKQVIEQLKQMSFEPPCARPEQK